MIDEDFLDILGYNERGKLLNEIIAIHSLTESDILDDVIMVLSYWPNLEYKNKNGFTSLHVACSKGYVKIINLLLEAGANAYNIDSDSDYDALENSALSGKIESVITLLKFGVDPNHNKGAALIFAILNNNTYMIDILMKYGMSIKSPVLDFGLSTLMYALLYSTSREKVIKCLLKYEVDINHVDFNGNTILHHLWCMAKDNLKFVHKMRKLLIKAGADETIKNNAGLYCHEMVNCLDCW